MLPTAVASHHLRAVPGVGLLDTSISAVASRSVVGLAESAGGRTAVLTRGSSRFALAASGSAAARTNSAWKSWTVGKRCCLSLASAFITTAATAGPTAGFMLVMGSGSS